MSRLSGKEIREILDRHEPYTRITSDMDTACDRQWLSMLDDVFSVEVDEKALVEFVGIVALKGRLCKH